MGEYDGAKADTSGKQSAAAAAQGELAAAEGLTAKEQQEAGQAELEAAQAKDRLAKAEAELAKLGGTQPELEARVAKEKKEYEMALETFKKEENDVKAVQKRVAIAKAELAKWE